MKLTKSQPRTLLDKLRNSVHDEVRNTVKELLNHLNQSSIGGYYSMPRNPQQTMNMYYSTTSESAYSSGGSTLLPTRGYQQQYPIVVHPVNPFIPYSPQHPQHHHQQQQQNTLPKSMRIFKSEQQQRDTVPSHSQDLSSQFLRDINLEAGRDIPESLLATRSGSVQSLTDEIGTDSSWRSSENTDAPNSADLSPVSESEIPDSPTEFAMKQVAISAQKYGHRSRKESSNPGSYNNDEDEEDLYGIKMHHDKTELSQAIVNALPPPKQSMPHSLQSTPRLPKPSNVIPQQLFREELQDEISDIDFDDESFNDEPVPPPSSIPSSSSTTTSNASAATPTTIPIPKNGESST
uniref:Uncharacterized protein n=1 Tax=Panagrolaimus sp. ES5 TaxID=591445 RepID=A0AC34GDT8_9BILA